MLSRGLSIVIQPDSQLRDTIWGMWLIGERLREQRGERKGELVAKELGISQSYISQLENGVNKPNWELLAGFARLYNCSVDYLVGLTDDPAPRINSGMTAEERGLLEIMRGLSERGRAEAAAMLQTIYEQDQRWQALDMYERFIGALGGEDYLARLADTFDALVRETGSVDAALDRLDALTSEQPAQDSIQHSQ